MKLFKNKENEADKQTKIMGISKQTYRKTGRRIKRRIEEVYNANKKHS